MEATSTPWAIYLAVTEDEQKKTVALQELKPLLFFYSLATTNFKLSRSSGAAVAQEGVVGDPTNPDELVALPLEDGSLAQLRKVGGREDHRVTWGAARPLAAAAGRQPPESGATDQAPPAVAQAPRGRGQLGWWRAGRAGWHGKR